MDATEARWALSPFFPNIIRLVHFPPLGEIPWSLAVCRWGFSLLTISPKPPKRIEKHDGTTIRAAGSLIVSLSISHSFLHFVFC